MIAAARRSRLFLCHMASLVLAQLEQCKRLFKRQLEEMLEEANKQETAAERNLKFWILNKEPKQHGAIEKLGKMAEEEVCPSS